MARLYLRRVSTDYGPAGLRQSVSLSHVRESVTRVTMKMHKTLQK
jgi:hypothetical protein